MARAENAAQIGKLERLEAERERVQKALNKWLEAYEKSSELTSTVIIERIEQFQRQIQALNEEIAKGRATGYFELNDTCFSKAYLTQLLKNFEETMAVGDIFDQRHLVKMFIDRIELGKKKTNAEREITIRSRLPLPTTDKVRVPDGI